ncbi:MAG: hypothetical protein AMJ73_07545 [candidate division Zixibacteria bacterium SM1_73]|nr:MAG: hypothetical protein AMJ73_07545 [candidate division Zixibacteria bacterium SM1_73]
MWQEARVFLAFLRFPWTVGQGAQLDLSLFKDCGQGQALFLRKISPSPNPSHPGRGKHLRLAFILTDTVQERLRLQKIPVGWESAPRRVGAEIAPLSIWTPRNDSRGLSSPAGKPEGQF